MRPLAFRLILCCIGAGGLCADAARAGDLALMVREVNAAQNQAARGDAQARAQAARRLDDVEKFLPSMSAEAWPDPKNVRAAAIYLLCGGSPRALRKLLDSKALPEQSAPLIAAALAYAEGRGKEAARLLRPIDPRRFPNVLGGHLALAEGGLAIGEDNARATRLLDVARLLTPDSLVEEAALRREVAILDPLREPDKFARLGRRYVARYANSPFAKNFWDTFGAKVVKVSSSANETQLARFQEVLTDPRAPNKIDSLFAIARRALLNAQPSVAAAQIDKAASCASSPAERARLRLYQSLLETMSGDMDKGLSEFDRVDRGALPRADLELLNIVAGAGARLRVGPPQEKDDGAETPALIGAAQRALADADAVLAKASRR